MGEVAIGLKAKGQRVPQRQVMLLGADQVERWALRRDSCPSCMGLARMLLQADTDCHRPYQGNKAEQGEDETKPGASSMMHIKPSLCCTIRLNTPRLPVHCRALGRPAPAGPPGSTNHSYCRQVGSQRQEQEGDDRVKDGLRL